MKKSWQMFSSILVVLFVIYYLYMAVNLAEFRKCLAEYTVHNLDTLQCR